MDTDLVATAVTFNSSMVNPARTVGPAPVVIVIDGACFPFNTVPFVAVIIALTR